MPTPKEELIHGIDLARAGARNVAIDPPLSHDRIADLEAKCGVALPADVRNLVEYAAGFSVGGFVVHFDGAGEPFEFENAFPCPIPIAADGRGNFWIVDVTSGGWGPVLFVAHDPPVVVVQSRDIAAFIGEVFSTGEVGKSTEAPVMEVWKRNPDVISYERALASNDKALGDFARQIGPGFEIADLRAATPGMGFAWGLAGPNAEVRRAGTQLIFATERKKRGMIARLFSR